MSPGRFWLARTTCLACLLAAGLLLCPTLRACAETSAHRLQRKLHKVEKKAGKALDAAGDKTGDLIPHVDVDGSFCIEIIELIIDVATDSEHERGQASGSEPKAKSPQRPFSKHISPAKQNP
jgi:hypothetical protein